MGLLLPSLRVRHHPEPGLQDFPCSCLCFPLCSGGDWQSSTWNWQFSTAAERSRHADFYCVDPSKRILQATWKAFIEVLVQSRLLTASQLFSDWQLHQKNEIWTQLCRKCRTWVIWIFHPSVFHYPCSVRVKEKAKLWHCQCFADCVFIDFTFESGVTCQTSDVTCDLEINFHMLFKPCHYHSSLVIYKKNTHTLSGNINI